MEDIGTGVSELLVATDVKVCWQVRLHLWHVPSDQIIPTPSDRRTPPSSYSICSMGHHQRRPHCRAATICRTWFHHGCRRFHHKACTFCFYCHYDLCRPSSTPFPQPCVVVTTLFLLLLLLWTFELYLILSYRYEDLLISWSYLLILSLDLLILSSDDDPRYVSLYIITYMHLTCLWLMSFIDNRHAFYTCCAATCFYLTLDMLWTHILHVFTLRTTHGH